MSTKKEPGMKGKIRRVERKKEKDQLFLTESNLQFELDQLDREANQICDNNSGKAEVTVHEMSHKKLSIKLQKLSVKEEEDEDYENDAPLSSDIEVIHNSQPPKLHSILKQRTVSESSDDHGLSPTSDSPKSDEDYTKLHRSVSFNNRVDSTSFHSNKCPQSVKTTLHNKRKKARRKENLKHAREERKRTNSTGSEYSSGEDLSDNHCHSDTPLINDDFEKIKEENENITEEVTKLAHAISKGFTESPPKSTTETQCVCQGKLENDVKKDGAASQQPLDFRTSGNKKKRNKGKGKGKKPYQGVSKCDSVSATESEENSTDNKSGHGAGKVNGVKNGEKQDDVNKDTKHKESKLSGITIGSGSIDKPGDLQKMIDESDSSVVRILGTGEKDEREKADSDDDLETATGLNTLASNEHRTQCAFQFTNTVIYDLDND